LTTLTRVYSGLFGLSLVNALKRTWRHPEDGTDGINVEDLVEITSQ
jgi:hypothetical protein